MSRDPAALFCSHIHNTLVMSADGPTASELARKVAVAADAGPWLRLVNKPIAGLARGGVRVLVLEQDFEVRSIAWSPDGRMLASNGAFPGTLLVWDVSTCTATRVAEAAIGRAAVVAWSSQGVLAAGTEEGFVCCWKADCSECVTLGKHEGAVTALAFSADGSLLASAGGVYDDGTVRIWDLASGSDRKLAGPSGVGVGFIAFAPTVPRLAWTRQYDNLVIHLSDVRGHDADILLETEKGAGSLAFMPEGDAVFVGDTTGRVHSVTVPDGPGRAVLRGDDFRVEAVAVSRDGSLAAAGGGDRRVRLWKIADPTLSVELAGHTGRITGASFSPDGRTLATCGTDDRTVRLWDTVSALAGRPAGPAVESHRNRVRCATISRGCDAFWTGSDDRTLGLWEAEAGTLERRADAESSVTVLAHSLDPDVVAFSGAGLSSKDESGTMIRLLDASRADAPLLVGKQPEGCGFVTALAFSRDGSLLASGGFDGGVCLWEVDRRHDPTVLPGHQSRVNGLAFSPDGSLLASTGGDTMLWRTEDWSRVAVLDEAADGLAFAPDGTLLAGVNGAYLTLWDVADTSRLVWMVMPSDVGGGARARAAFDATSRYLAVVAGARVSIWDTRRLRLAPLQDGRVVCGDDGCKMIVSCSAVRELATAIAHCLSEVLDVRFLDEGLGLLAVDNGGATGDAPVPYRFELRIPEEAAGRDGSAPGGQVSITPFGVVWADSLATGRGWP